ncbi:MAG: sulfite reductase flavoprotein subunit alpha [Pseudomonadota bacterium]|nr:sulfite reductase flavoprotein subunit alpha [Pseudomonadota bacterium]MEC8103222.1 sulfite reductase flavoprotein subunit alpha [Pseudomonadota bacterium]MEC8523015.1 sulfite reductase flavoprotein subunit alpha [Pseudomonadota bacterium]MEE2749094.1 sulfite reductase flavoprotein subunit alpha [Pseudomonadota bacterium]
MSEQLITELSSVIDANMDSGTLIELPEGAPFDAEQRQWLNGLLTGISTIAAAAAGATQQEAPATPLAIFYGSQSGNCEVVSKDLKKHAATCGFEAKIEELNSITPADLAQHQHVLIVCSTFGEGEPPDNARRFYDLLMADDAAAIPASVNFSVCGLGDSSYTHFNKCASDINTRLQQLGATPCHDYIGCDAAFEDDVAEWKAGVFATPAFLDAAGAASTPSVATTEKEALYTKNTPFIANLIESRNLSGEGSSKRVNHIEISLAGGGEDMDYHAGDALGVWPLNCPEEVSEILAAGGFSGKEVVQQKSGAATLRVLLQTRLDIHTVNAKCLEAWGLNEAPLNYKVFDVLNELKPELDAQTFVDGLRALQPRLYSIASSPKKHPGEVHLTVGEVHYDFNDKARKGVASTWLGNRLPEGNGVGVYVVKSEHFHITSNDDAPVIMIGPGTGIAPFRAFLEEREMREASGENWLFFGDQHQASDFLYRDEITAWQDSGVLNKTSLAWSRDTDRKIYVQTLIKDQGAEFFEWLERGAYIYICGDASRMAADVDSAIREVIAEHGSTDEAGANDYMNRLVSEHRYQRDVY